MPLRLGYRRVRGLHYAGVGAAVATDVPLTRCQGGSMSLAFLGEFHPQIVHTPIVMLIFSALFGILARLFDRDWLKKMSTVMLVVGFLGSFLAVQSGKPAHRVPEHEQGVPEEEIDEHGENGERVMYLAGGALVAIGLASRLTGTPAALLGTAGLLLQIGSAVLVGITGHAGGELVYEYGANVKVNGVLVKNTGGGEAGEARASDASAPADTVATEAAGADAAKDKDHDKD
jgi:uncharacterized membrane protein